MKKDKEKHLYIKIAEFANEHPQGFTYADLKTNLQIADNGWEDETIKCYMFNALKSGRSDWSIQPGGGSQNWVNPSMDSMFFVIKRGSDESKLDVHLFILKYDAFFNYMDYLEFQEAIKSSNTAKKYAIWAIIISAILSLTSILIQIDGSVSLDSKHYKKNINHLEYKNRR